MKRRVDLQEVKQIKNTSNQFHRKEYSVPLCGVYPIVSSASVPTSIDDASDTSDSDDDIAPTADVPEESGSSELDSESDGDEEVRADEEQVRVERPRRDTRAPAWQKDYVMD